MKSVFEMSQLWQLTVQEIRLYLRSKTFWLIGTLIVLAMFLPILALFLIQYMAIIAVTRDESSGFYEIFASLSYDTFQIYLARYLAVLCLLLGLWPLIVLTIGFLPGMTPADWLFNGEYFTFLTLKYIIICMAAVGSVFLAGLLTHRRWRLCLIAAACWAIGDFFSSHLLTFPSWSTFFAFGHGVMRLMAPSAAVGYFPQQDLILRFALIQAALAVLFLVFAVAIEKIKRRERILQSKLLLLLVLIIVIVFSFACPIAGRELNTRESGFQLAVQEVKGPEILAVKTGLATTPVMESYKLAIKLRTKAHYLEGRATIGLDMADQTEVIVCTLRNYFKVETVTETNRGDTLKWQREGSHLAVYIPESYRYNRKLTLEIFYSGQVWEWFTDPFACPNGPLNFVATQFSLLRSGYGWYPIPGYYPLYTREYYTTPWHRSPEITLLANRIAHPAVLFDLTVDLDNNDTVVSNLEQSGTEPLRGEYKKRFHFKSLHGRDVFLITGPYHYEKRTFRKYGDFIEAYSYRQHQNRITKALNSIAAPYLFYEDLFQTDRLANPKTARYGKVCTVVEMPPFSFLSGEGCFDESLTLTDTVLISEELFPTETWRLAAIAFMQANKLDLAVLQRWWQEDVRVESNRNGNIVEGVMLYGYILYMEKTQGRAFYRQIKENVSSGKRVEAGNESFLLPFFTGGPVIRDVFMILDAIRTPEYGDPAIKQIMRQLYQVYVSKGTIGPAEFVKVVKTAVMDANWPPAKTDEIRNQLENIVKDMHVIATRKLKPASNITIYTFRPEDWLP
jgi:hypothetical protein